MRLPGIVAIEHIDGGGGTTQAKLLADYLDGREFRDGEARTLPCLRLSFPAYDTPIGALILSKLKGEWDALTPGDITGPEDRSALVLQSLMIANKFELADEIERANVVEGRSVILDRYVVSGLAYGQADGLPLELLERLHARLPKAHHVFIDIPVEESFKRRPERTDAYEADRGRLSRARTNYLHLFEKYGVDTAYWFCESDGNAVRALATGATLANWSQEYRTSPSGYAIVNGMGEVSEVQDRIRKVLGL